jgi:EAL domain-containing protein (putative c-di-GMP-specific phosphodiesterase class I)
VAGIITMMSTLGGRIIAEGVETENEYAWLRSQGIALFQGYLFARPAFEALPEPYFPD